MNDKLDLYDPRVEAETYAQSICECFKEQESWEDLVLFAATLCSEIKDTRACSEDGYVSNVLLTAVACLLMESKDVFSDSDHERELAVLRSTKRALEEAISQIQDEIAEAFTEIVAPVGIRV